MSNFSARPGGTIILPEEISSGQFVRIGMSIKPGEGYSLERVAHRIARLWSNETSHDQRLRSHVVDEPENGRIDIAVPTELLQTHLGVTQLVSILSLPSEYGFAESFRIERLELHHSALKKYGGPKHGVEGIRKAFSVPDGPLVGAILKPQLVCDIASIKEAVVKIAQAGLDFIVDDELIIDPDGLRFEERVGRICEQLERENSKNNLHAGFIANVTAAPSKSKRLVKAAREFGARGVVTNALVTGFGSIEDLTRSKDSLPIFSTNIGAAMLAKGANGGATAGMTEGIIAKIARLAGADAVHAGIESVDWYDKAPRSGTASALSGRLGTIRPAFRVVAGGLNVVSLIENWPTNDEPIIFEGGGSIFSHPDGVSGGAFALQRTRQIASEYVTSDPQSKNEALAALLKVANEDKRIENSITSCSWKPTDEVLERSRTIKLKKHSGFWRS